jgi:hypothetical protein
MLKLKILAWCNGLEYFIFYLYYGTNSYVAAVVYLAYGDIVLGHGCVGVFYTGINSEAFIQKLLILVFARFWCWKLIYIYIYYFVLLEEGTIVRSFSVVV